MIYFDNAATTKPCAAAVDAVSEAMTQVWGNPSSVHGAGNAALARLTQARRTVEKALGVRRETEGKVFFTGSGTEADSLAVLGSVYAKKRPIRDGHRGRILTTDSEHAAIEETLSRLAADGFEICRIPTRGGVLDMDYVRAHAEGVILATVMLVNNETGALYDVKRVFEAVRAASPRAVTHVDAVQAFLKVRFSPAALSADTVSVSAHKIGGPKGVGALYVSRAVLTARALAPVITGGGQEEGMRSGTENMPGILGFAAACRAGDADFEKNGERVAALRARLLASVADNPALTVLAPPAFYAGIVPITVSGVRSETVLNFLSARGICVSAGSACSTHATHKGNRVLAAYGMSEAEADSTVRVSMSAENTEAEIDALASALSDAAALQHRR